VALVALSAVAFGYGPTAHETVGGVADKLLENTAAQTQIASLLDGISLEKAAVMPDEIKAWDRDGADDLGAFPHYSQHPEIDKQLRAFWLANQPTHDRASEAPSHHWFHYTDVPVVNPQKYSDGKAGRSRWDIVQIIGYCVDVLRGDAPEENPRKITKPVAVILLAHFLADIHEPMHVGAQFFDEAGRPVDPDKTQPGFGDEGGNTIALRLSSGTPEVLAKRSLKLHGFWDNDAVVANLSLPVGLAKEQRSQAIEKAKRALIDQFARNEPANWRVPANVPLNKYAEAWADDILPRAREAHERLEFTGVHPLEQEDRTVAAGVAVEKSMPDQVGYTDWAANIVREELHKAGWRLADLLRQVVASSGTTTKSATIATSLAAPSPSPSPSQTPVAPAPAATTTIASTPFGEYPANYKEIVSAWLKANSLDGSNVQWQGEPKPAETPAGDGRKLSGYLVIFNTQERSGLKTRSVLIRDGAVISNSGF